MKFKFPNFAPGVCCSYVKTLSYINPLPNRNEKWNRNRSTTWVGYFKNKFCIKAYVWCKICCSIMKVSLKVMIELFVVTFSCENVSELDFLEGALRKYPRKERIDKKIRTTTTADLEFIVSGFLLNEECINVVEYLIQSVDLRKESIARLQNLMKLL